VVDITVFFPNLKHCCQIERSPVVRHNNDGLLNACLNGGLLPTMKCTKSRHPGEFSSQVLFNHSAAHAHGIQPNSVPLAGAMTYSCAFPASKGVSSPENHHPHNHYPCIVVMLYNDSIHRTGHGIGKSRAPPPDDSLCLPSCHAIPTSQPCINLHALCFMTGAHPFEPPSFKNLFKL